MGTETLATKKQLIEQSGLPASSSSSSLVIISFQSFNICQYSWSVYWFMTNFGGPFLLLLLLLKSQLYHRQNALLTQTSSLYGWTTRWMVGQTPTGVQLETYKLLNCKFRGKTIKYNIDLWQISLQSPILSLFPSLLPSKATDRWPEYENQSLPTHNTQLQWSFCSWRRIKWLIGTSRGWWLIGG